VNVGLRLLKSFERSPPARQARQIIDLLTRDQDGAAFCNLARSFNPDPSIAEKAQQALAPQIMYSTERNRLSRGGLTDLSDLLERRRQPGPVEIPRGSVSGGTLQNIN
jgi:hypothetical protein